MERYEELEVNIISFTQGDVVASQQQDQPYQTDALYKAALMNMVAASTCYALEKAGIHHDDFELKKAKALRLTVLMKVEWNVVSAALDKAGQIHGRAKSFSEKTTEKVFYIR